MLTPQGKPQVLPFLSSSQRHDKLRMAKCQPKTHGGATSSRPSLYSPGPSAEVIRARLQSRLQRLDGDQLQIIEIVIAAISRGAA